MKKRNIALPWIVILLLVFSLSGCSLTEIDMSTADADEIIAASLVNTAMIESLDATYVIDTALTIDGETLAFQDTTEATTFISPLTVKYETTSATTYAGDTTSETYVLYAEGTEDNLVAYYSDGTDWYQETVDDEARYTYDSRSDILFVLGAVADGAVTGTETLNGEETTIVTGTMNEDALADTVYNSGILEIFNYADSILLLVPDLLTDLGEVPVTVWFNNESVLPVQYEIDLAPILEELSARILENMDVIDPDWALSTLSIDQFTEKSILFNFDNGTTFEIPAEAKGE